MSVVALSRVAADFSEAAALASGIQAAFVVAAVLATVGIGLTLLMPATEPAAAPAHGGGH